MSVWVVWLLLCILRLASPTYVYIDCVRVLRSRWNGPGVGRMMITKHKQLTNPISDHYFWSSCSSYSLLLLLIDYFLILLSLTHRSSCAVATFGCNKLRIYVEIWRSFYKVYDRSFCQFNWKNQFHSKFELSMGTAQTLERNKAFGSSHRYRRHQVLFK